MKKNNAFSIAIFLSLSLTTTQSYSQHLWSRLQHQPVLKARTSISPFAIALPADPLSMELTTFAYNKINAQSITTTTSQAYKGATPVGTTYRQKALQDTLTGQPLIQYHGIDNQDTLKTAYDALGRPTSTTNTEHDLAQTKHITREQITYTMTATGTSVTLAQLDNKTRDGIAFTQTTQYNTLGQKLAAWDNLPEHQLSEATPAVTYAYNDLGQVNATTHFPAANNNYTSQETARYDAQGRVTTQTTLVALHNNPLADTQQLSALKTYDDVANIITTQEQGQWFKSGAQASELLQTGKQTQTLDDNQQILTDTLAPTPTAHGLTDTDDTLNTLNTYNNLGQKRQETTRASRSDSPILSASYQYDGLGNMQTTKIGTDATAVNVAFQLDLNGALTTKQVNNTRTYYFDKGLQGETLAEYRGDINSDLSHALVQHYNYTNGGYRITQYGWTPNSPTATPSTITTTNTYGDVNNKKVILQQVTTDGNNTLTSTFTYNYATGNVLHVEKTLTGDTNSTSSIDTTYRADGNILNITYDAATDPKSLTYTYDEQDHITTKTDIAGMLTHYTYDGGLLQTSELRKATDPNGQIYASTKLTYDALGELTQNQRYQGAIGSGKEIDNLVYQYDAYKNINEVDFKKTDAAGEASFDYITYVNDTATGNIHQQTEYQADTDASTTTIYTYEPNTNHLLSSNVSPKQRGLQQLPTASNTTSYATDVLGNVTAKTTNTTTNTYQYNALGQHIGQGITHDTQGNLTSDDQGNTLTWTVDNQEKSYWNKAQNITTHYSYPLHGRDKTQTLSNGTQIRLATYYVGGQLTNEIQTGGENNNGYQSAYLDNGIRVILDKSGNVTTTEFLQHDKTGTVVSCLSLQNDGSTPSQTHYHYNDEGGQENEGQTIDATLSILNQSLRFNGDYADAETMSKQGGEMDYKLARSVIHFADGVTQFASADYDRQYMSNYAYDEANSINLRDPTGHDSKNLIGVIAAGAVFLGLIALDVAVKFAGDTELTQNVESMLDNHSNVDSAASPALPTPPAPSVGSSVSNESQSSVDFENDRELFSPSHDCDLDEHLEKLRILHQKLTANTAKIPDDRKRFLESNLVMQLQYNHLVVYEREVLDGLKIEDRVVNFEKRRKALSLWPEKFKSPVVDGREINLYRRWTCFCLSLQRAALEAQNETQDYRRFIPYITIF